ncbi:MAG TPA: FtsX-like permease family protein [Vicinamibacteria bacterium]|nr:FtsX-like permease family protein [Vicinamibacteria bacterium]
MRLLLTLALRNLFRHKRRTLLTAAALVLGIALMVLGRAWTAAMEKAVVEPAKDSTLGHVQVYAKDAAADEGGEISFIVPQNNYRLVPEPRKLIERMLATEPRLAGGLSRMMVGALLSNGDESMEGILIGIDPEARAAVYPAIGLREGRHFAPGEKGVLLNRGVARKLSAKVGDTIVALGNTSDGRLSAVKLNVTGIWWVKGLEAYEWGACYADLAAVQELMDAPDQAGVLVLRQKDPKAPAAPIAAALNAAFAREGVAAEARTWEEMGGPFIGGMTLTRFVADIMDMVMTLIVAAGVLNTALMSVFERTREVGTLRAVGAKRSRVLVLYLAEAVLLGLGAAALGGALGALAVVFFGRYGIPAFSEAQRYSYGGDYLFPTLDMATVVTVPAVMVVVCVIAAFGPAVMAARMRPADSLRYV